MQIMLYFIIKVIQEASLLSTLPLICGVWV